MIFNIQDNSEEYYNYESYKERNFYYKIFAGYLFNELLPTYHQNKIHFFSLLKDQIGTDQKETDQFYNAKPKFKDPLPQILHDISFDGIQVSFDYHLAQIGIEGTDRGEMSDIVLWGKDYFVSIEVKYLSDWTYEKDIREVQARIEQIETEIKKQGIQVLLLSGKKWKNSQTHKTHPGSNYYGLKQNDGNLYCPLIIITWEQLIEIISSQKVRNYIKQQLDRKNSKKLPT